MNVGRTKLYFDEIIVDHETDSSSEHLSDYSNNSVLSDKDEDDEILSDRMDVEEELCGDESLSNVDEEIESVESIVLDDGDILV